MHYFYNFEKKEVGVDSVKMLQSKWMKAVKRSMAWGIELYQGSQTSSDLFW